MIFGRQSGAAVKDTVSVLKSGEYVIKIRYAAPKANIDKLSLYVNGKKVSSPTFKKDRFR